jgi:hypothetical protein
LAFSAGSSGRLSQNGRSIARTTTPEVDQGRAEHGGPRDLSL